MDGKDHFDRKLNAPSKDLKYDVFISYRREGGSETSRSIKESLEKRGVRVFLDDGFDMARFDLGVEDPFRLDHHERPSLAQSVTTGLFVKKES